MGEVNLGMSLPLPDKYQGKKTSVMIMLTTGLRGVRTCLSQSSCGTFRADSGAIVGKLLFYSQEQKSVPLPLRREKTPQEKHHKFYLLMNISGQCSDTLLKGVSDVGRACI